MSRPRLPALFPLSPHEKGRKERRTIAPMLSRREAIPRGGAFRIRLVAPFHTDSARAFGCLREAARRRDAPTELSSPRDEQRTAGLRHFGRSHARRGLFGIS